MAGRTKLSPERDAEPAVLLELQRLAAAVQQGDLRARAGAQELTGTARETALAVNGMLDTLCGPLHVAAQSIGAIAQGELPGFIVDDYPGELNAIKRGINAFLASMYGMHLEVANFVAGIKAGRLRTRLNDWDFAGRWQALLAGLNETIDTFDAPFAMAAEHVARISRGEIPPPVATRYQGDLRQLKRNLNTLIAAIRALVDDTHGLCGAAAAGRLSERAEAARHQGDFRRVVEGVNEALDAVVGPLRESAVVLASISQGDLTAAFGHQLNGDYAKLQSDIEQMVANLRRSMAEIAATAATLAASSSQLSAVSSQLSSVADVTAERSQAAAEAGATVSGSVQSVVSGAESILTSLQEIARETQSASAMAANAVGAAGAATGSIAKLRDANGKVGEIAGLIAAIAGQTGALATQAGAQAGLAGESGRGFSTVAGEVQRLAQATREATEQIQDRSKEMGGVIGRMGQAGAGGETAAQLQKTNREIGAVAKSIGMLAMRCHLLALNANIEAARAESAGRGFGEVVVGVQGLTTRTAAAAEEIERQMQSVRADTETSTQSIAALAGVVESVDAASRAISTAVEEQTATTAGIQAALNGAAQATEEIVTSIAGVAKTARETNALTGETRQAAETLHDIAGRMQALVGEFRL